MTSTSKVAEFKIGDLVEAPFFRGPVVRLGEAFPARKGGMARTIEIQTGPGSWRSSCFADGEITAVR